MPRLARLVVVSGLVGTGCPVREVTAIDPVQSRQVRKDIPLTATRDLDILFVIDNSGSMTEEQQMLTDNFAAFMNVFEVIPGGLPNLHIGVVSSNVGAGGAAIASCGGAGDDGRLQSLPRGACQGPTGAFISDVQDPAAPTDPTRRLKNYDGTLADTFTCIAELGTDGCGFEQHLESMRRALDGSQSQNDGFLRHDAFLAVVFIADEDDCSASDPILFDRDESVLGPLASFRCTEYGVECDGGSISRSAATYQSCEPREDSFVTHPQEYVDFLKGLKDDPGLVVTAGIIGLPTSPVVVDLNADGEPELQTVCGNGWVNGEAAPAVRLKWFMEQFSGNHMATTICQTNLTDPLAQIADLVASRIGNYCLDASLDATDTDPEEAGLQVECQITTVRHPGSADETQETLARCDIAADGTPSLPASAPACWYVESNPTACNGADEAGLELKTLPSPYTAGATAHLVADCVAK